MYRGLGLDRGGRPEAGRGLDSAKRLEAARRDARLEGGSAADRLLRALRSFLVEGLESRLLLSTTPETAHVLAVEFASPPLVAIIHHELITKPTAPSSPATGLFELTPVLLTDEPTPPMIVFIQPRVDTAPEPVSEPLSLRPDPSPPTELLPTPLDTEPAPRSTVASVGIGVTSGETTPLTPIADGIGDASDVARASSSTGTPATSSPSHSSNSTTSEASDQAPAHSNGPAVAPVAPPPAAALPSAPPSVATGPVPQTKALDVQGTLDPSRNSESIAIALDSGPESLGLTIQQTANTSGTSTPVVTSLLLVNSAGSPLEEVGSGTLGQAGLAQSLSVALSGAAAGGRLVVQISAASASSSPGGSDASTASESSSSDSSVPFVLQVQRLSSNTSIDSTAGGQPGQATAGSLTALNPTTSASMAPDATSLGVTPAANDNGTPASATPTQVATLADVGSAATADGADDGFSPRMPTGPLASRERRTAGTDPGRCRFGSGSPGRSARDCFCARRQ